MNYKPFFILIFFLKSFPSFALGTDTVKLFYDINKYELSSDDKLKINTLVKALAPTDTIKIVGFADYLGDDGDNLLLSENRAETIFNYLLTLKIGFVSITYWKGAIHAHSRRSPDGEPRNRRVDIIKSKRIPNSNLALNAPKSKPAAPKSDPPPTPGPDGTINMSTPEDKRPFKERINNLAKLEIGSSLSLQEITFQPGRHFLNPQAVPYIDTLLKYLKKHTNIVFEIQGHICCGFNDGDSFDYDTRENGLSTNRAKFIYDYFVQKGINSERMTYKGLGSSKPKVWPEITEYDRFLNRRVEILITGK